jgi:hypothetical protein
LEEVEGGFLDAKDILIRSMRNAGPSETDDPLRGENQCLRGRDRAVSPERVFKALDMIEVKNS